MNDNKNISNFIDKLLKGRKVEWKKLGEVANYEQPSKYLVKSTNYNDKYNIPVLTAGKTFILGYTNEEEGIYEASKSPVIIFDDFTTANKWINFDFKIKSSAIKIITSKIEDTVLLKYIYYWLNTLPNELIEGDHKRQWINNFSRKKLPIPPLDVQEEIVRILDKFTELTTGLTTELTDRKKQYEYYRDKLLTPIEKDGKWFLNGKEVEWKKLGEVAELKRGRVISKQYLENNPGTYPVYSSQTVNNGEIGRINTFDFDGEFINWTTDGANAGTVFYRKGKFSITNVSGLIKIFDTKILNYKYLYYWLSIEAKKHVYYGMGNPKLMSNQVAKISIPIPPLEEQERIVSILDKFDTLTNSISEGLPKEIELRQKQYEYYRDMLLSFPEEENEVKNEI